MSYLHFERKAVIIKFLKTKGKRPLIKSTTAWERVLASQLISYTGPKNRLFDAAFRNAVSALVPFTKRVHKDPKQRVLDLVDFIYSNGRLPRAAIKNESELYNTSKNYTNLKRNPKLFNVKLHKLVLEFSNSVDSRKQDILKYCEEHGKRPQEYAIKLFSDRRSDRYDPSFILRCNKIIRSKKASALYLREKDAIDWIKRNGRLPRKSDVNSSAGRKERAAAKTCNYFFSKKK